MSKHRVRVLVDGFGYLAVGWSLASVCFAGPCDKYQSNPPPIDWNRDICSIFDTTETILSNASPIHYPYEFPILDQSEFVANAPQGQIIYSVRWGDYIVVHDGMRYGIWFARNISASIQRSSKNSGIADVVFQYEVASNATINKAPLALHLVAASGAYILGRAIDGSIACTSGAWYQKVVRVQFPMSEIERSGGLRLHRAAFSSRNC